MFLALALLFAAGCADIQPEAGPPTNGLHYNEFLVCTRHHETPGHNVWPYDEGYVYVPTNGYHGAYQFAQGTWDGAVDRAGYPEWVGIGAEQAPVEVQDATAWQLYQERGNEPWGGRC